MTTRYYWNDDDRKNDYISYYDRKEDEYVPVYKILKEMYDEDKANLYIYDTEEEYHYKYGQYYFDKYCDYYNEYYSPYYDFAISSKVDIDTNEDAVVLCDAVVENEIEQQENVEEEQVVEFIDEIKSKFIYT